MPQMVTIKPTADFKPEQKDASAWKAVKDAGEKRVSYVTAVEAVRQSKGMYEIVQDEPSAVMTAPRLEDMDINALKQMYLQVGGQITGKQMKRSEIITAIRAKLDQVEIVDDDAADA